MIVNVKVKPNQKSFGIKKTDDTNWIISVKSSPEKNQANQEIIKELLKVYDSVRIIKGLKSKNKIIEIFD